MPEENIDISELFHSDSEAEPLKKPTEKLKEENPEELTAEELAAKEAEELEAKPEGKEDTSDILVFEINDKEYTAEDIEALEAGNLMQADYTQKTQALADDRKLFDTEKTNFEADKLKISDLSAQLEVLVAEDGEIDWAELKADNPDEYIVQKEKADARKAKLAEVKAEQAKQPEAQVLTQEEQVAESADFYAYDKAWQDDGKLTQAFTDDMKMAGEYLQSQGYSQDEVNNITHAHHWKTIVDAARFSAIKNKPSALRKKVKQAPKVTKPNANQSDVRSAASIMYDD